MKSFLAALDFCLTKKQRILDNKILGYSHSFFMNVYSFLYFYFSFQSPISSSGGSETIMLACVIQKPQTCC